MVWTKEHDSSNGHWYSLVRTHMSLDLFRNIASFAPNALYVLGFLQSRQRNKSSLRSRYRSMVDGFWVSFVSLLHRKAFFPLHYGVAPPCWRVRYQSIPMQESTPIYGKEHVIVHVLAGRPPTWSRSVCMRASNVRRNVPPLPSSQPP